MAKQDGFLSNSFRDADQSLVHRKLGMFGCLQALNRTFGLDSAAGCCSYLRIQLVSKSYIIISGLVVVMQGRVAVFSFKLNDGLLWPIPKWATYRHRHKHILHLQGIIEQGIQWSVKYYTSNPPKIKNSTSEMGPHQPMGWWRWFFRFFDGDQVGYLPPFCAALAITSPWVLQGTGSSKQRCFSLFLQASFMFNMIYMEIHG
jgi:hypothetical protein